jgi:hypothetical protein
MRARLQQRQQGQDEVAGAGDGGGRDQQRDARAGLRGEQVRQRAERATATRGAPARSRR